MKQSAQKDKLRQNLSKRGYFMEMLFIFGMLILVSYSILAQGTLDSGLIAFWPFSRNADDSTGHGHNGLVAGAILTLDRFGRDSMAYDFNGTTSSYIQVADDSSWAFGVQPFTIVVWANFRVLNQYFLMGQTEGPGSTNKWMIQYEGGILRFHLNSPQTGPIYPVQYSWVPSTSHWYLITVTRDANLFSLYVDSTLRAANQDMHAVPNTNAPLHIGKTEGRGFNGQLDDIRIYNRALSIQEIRTLFSSGLTGVAEESGIPITFSLSQNYPNPFNPVTTIKYSLPKFGKTRLVVYDILGKTVTTLVDDELKDAGTYEVQWNASNFSSGIYFYKLITGDPSAGSGQSFTDVKKMLMIK